MPIFVRRTLFWKYAAYFSGLVSALLILSGGIGGYFAYRESTAALEALQRAKAQGKRLGRPRKIRPTMNVPGGSVREAARIWGVSKSTAARWINSGRSMSSDTL